MVCLFCFRKQYCRHYSQHRIQLVNNYYKNYKVNLLIIRLSQISILMLIFT